MTAQFIVDVRIQTNNLSTGRCLKPDPQPLQKIAGGPAPPRTSSCDRYELIDGSAAFVGGAVPILVAE